MTLPDPTSPIPLQERWAYGPIASRRFGRSLGVNLLPLDRKVCTMACAYCQYGDGAGGGRIDRDALPAPAQVLAAVERALAGRPAIDAITVAGNGEPTVHPELHRITEGLVALRDRLSPGTPLVLLTNGTRLDLPRVRDAIRLFDRPVVKLDAGEELAFRAVNRPNGASLARVVRGLQGLGRRFTAQALFVRGAVDNATPAALQAWARTLLAVRPADVQVTTLDRGTALAGLRPVPAAALEEIAAGVRRLGIPAAAFPCGSEARFASQEEVA